MDIAFRGSLGSSQGDYEAMSQPCSEVVAVRRWGFIGETEEWGCNVRCSPDISLVTQISIGDFNHVLCVMTEQ